jgi:LEA14-like dessication related protein
MRGVLNRLAISLAAAGLAAGCSTLGTRLERPEVYLLRITPLESTLFEQRVETEFRLRNPNDVDLDVSGLDLQIGLNGRRLVRVLSGESTVVPRFGEATLKAVASTSTFDILRQVEALGRATEAPAYEISGYVYLGRAFSRRRVRLDSSGKLLPER